MTILRWVPGKLLFRFFMAFLTGQRPCCSEICCKRESGSFLEANASKRLALASFSSSNFASFCLSLFFFSKWASILLFSSALITARAEFFESTNGTSSGASSSEEHSTSRGPWSLSVPLPIVTTIIDIRKSYVI